MIELIDITFKTPGKIILNQINLTIKQGEKWAIYGESGSGKTTLLKTILGFVIPATGHLLHHHRQITAKNIHTLRNDCSYIGQIPIMGAENVRDALLLPFSYKSNQHRKPEEEEIIRLLQQFHLDPGILHQETEKLSGGEKQRIAVIRSLLLGKKIFVLDEVTSGLDSQSKKAVLGLLHNPEYTIISVSHDVEWIEQCGCFVCLVNGRIQSIDYQFSKEVIRKMKGVFDE